MKKYLNSVEEVVKALKEGKKVCLYSKQNLMEYYMIDGIICSKDNINVCIWFRESDKYYTEEPEPLKFEVNKPYKTKSGYKAFLDLKTKNEIYFLCDNAPSRKYQTNIEGKTYSDMPESFNIVGYWEEEK